uniref:NAC transcription factor 42 n=1 Tax=Litchi chinensis TaxID=151069 RepID=A0A8K1I0D3_LITCN|nr:NAC transcription factor 42 [Litchi chinensis]
MEDFVVKGGIRVPIGYRFLPTDAELVDYYLKRKLLGLPLPASIIPDQLDVFNTDPWSLPGDLEEKRYFFGKRNGDTIWSGKKIGAGSGYWKCNGKTKQIHVDSGGQSKAAAVGRRTTLVFRQGKRARTGWFMREYRLVLGTITTNTNSTTQCEMGSGDWAVYCIFQRKKKGTKKHGSSISAVCQHDLSNSNNIKGLTCGMAVMNTPNSNSIESSIEETDFFTAIQPSVSACLSDVTVETPSNGFDEEVISSACNTCSP